MTFKEFLLAEAKKKRKKKHQGLPIFPVGSWLFDKVPGGEAPSSDSSTGGDGGGE